MKIFLAGATGAIGTRLLPILVAAGHDVIGTTRSKEKAAALEAAGARAAVVDVFDAASLLDVVQAAQPDAVIHQLTALPKGLDPAGMATAVKDNARIRDEGTRNLVAAAKAAGARRLIAQSIAWAYAPGEEPFDESSPLDLAATGMRAISVCGVIALERQVLESGMPECIVLRYGQLYGPGTGRHSPEGTSPLHVDAAAYAAFLAVDHGPAGIYNIAETNPHVTAAKAKSLLGWNADLWSVS